MSDRPTADALVPLMLEAGRVMRLSAHARRHLLADPRCPNWHLIAATVRTPYGPWIVSRSGLWEEGWRYDWIADLPDPGALVARCQRCRTAYLLDVSNPAAPTRRRWRQDAVG